MCSFLFSWDECSHHYHHLVLLVFMHVFTVEDNKSMVGAFLGYL